ncbi:unnamed protein product [Mytilus coruscus]|uniref:Uncharacterized protein n=1 Tax=Mytilus coruscus TaxID=42192 RepID=A0A6J8ECW1_MYTCO|nr:unnamed protein product [Mytilus coruscus]
MSDNRWSSDEEWSNEIVHIPNHTSEITGLSDITNAQHRTSISTPIEQGENKDVIETRDEIETQTAIEQGENTEVIGNREEIETETTIEQVENTEVIGNIDEIETETTIEFIPKLENGKRPPETWKKNIRKKLRLSGKEYISVKGTVVEEKKVKPVDCSKCFFRCHLGIDDEHRQQIFKTFWSLDTNDRKKDFIIANTTQKITRTYLDDNNEPVKKRKMFTDRTNLTLMETISKYARNFFLTTLGISETFANNALQNQQDGVGEDKRGKHAPYNKTTNTAMDLVRRHIESFPVVDGHYTRKDSNKEVFRSRPEYKTNVRIIYSTM